MVNRIQPSFLPHRDSSSVAGGMAKEGERPTGAAEKGKGKVEDARELNGPRKNAKDDKAPANGKKNDKKDEPQEGNAPAALLDLLIRHGLLMLWQRS